MSDGRASAREIPEMPETERSSFIIEMRSKSLWVWLAADAEVDLVVAAVVFDDCIEGHIIVLNASRTRGRFGMSV